MSNAGGIWSLAKDVLSGAERVKDRQKIMELVTRAMELEDENRALRMRIDELGAGLAMKKRLETIAGASYVLEEDGSRTGPVCKRCYDEKGLTIRLVRWYGKGARCANCGTVYPGIESGIDDPKAQRVSR